MFLMFSLFVGLFTHHLLYVHSRTGRFYFQHVYNGIIMSTAYSPWVNIGHCLRQDQIKVYIDIAHGVLSWTFWSRCKCFLYLFACVSVTSALPLLYKLDQYAGHIPLDSHVLTHECVSDASDVTATLHPNFWGASAAWISDRFMLWGYREGLPQYHYSHFCDAGVKKSSCIAALQC